MRPPALQTGDRVAWQPSGFGVVAATGSNDPLGRGTVAVWECGGARSRRPAGLLAPMTRTPGTLPETELAGALAALYAEIPRMRCKGRCKSHAPQGESSGRRRW